MKIPLFTLMLSGVLSFHLLAETCNVSPEQLIAKYQIKQLDKQGQLQSSQLDLYRYNQAVGHYFPDQTYGDWWSKNQNDQVMLMRYFPRYHKAIEYQAEDLKDKALNRKSFWQKKQQLISSSLLSKMQVEQVTGHGCYQVKILNLREDGKTYQVRWLPRLRLIERFDVLKGSKVQASWLLKEIVNDKALINTYVANIHQYQTTDYADIGDNEQDPLLSKMIYQGFTIKTDVTSEHEHEH